MAGFPYPNRICSQWSKSYKNITFPSPRLHSFIRAQRITRLLSLLLRLPSPNQELRLRFHHIKISSMTRQVSLTLAKVLFGLFVLIMMVKAADARGYPHGHYWHLHPHHHHHHHASYNGQTSSASKTLTSSGTLGSAVAVLCYMTLQYLL